MPRMSVVAPSARLIAAVAVALAACAHGAVVVPAGVRLWEPEQATTAGEVAVAGEPAAIYAELADYARWTSIFPDVARVHVKWRRGDEAAVLLVTKEGQNNNLVFHNDPSHLAVRFEDTGGTAKVWAEIKITAGPEAGVVMVHGRLYADVPGFLGLFVSDARLRHERRRKLSSDLANIRRYFDRHGAAGPAGSE
jgi:Polyketide cyclase / dehydrase and lipid transport